jgi:thioredoxin-related protein
MFDSKTRRARLALATLALVTLLCAGGPSADAGPHPIYRSAGSVNWINGLDAAKAEATRGGKLILVELSQPRCGACRLFVEQVLRDPSLSRRTQAIAIGTHIDGRRQYTDRRVVRMFQSNLSNRSYLPWVGFTTADGSWISGFAPGRTTTRESLRSQYEAALTTAETIFRALKTDHVLPAEPLPVEPVRPPVVQPPIVQPPVVQPPIVQPPVVQPPIVQPAQPRPVVSSGRLEWFQNLAAAQSAARAQGKMIFAIAVKPSCSLCDKLKNNVIPPIASQLAQKCVIYTYDITKTRQRPASRPVDRTVRANLPGAYLMPLTGFMTPELRWLHGFFGSTSGRQVISTMNTADARK